MIWKSLVLLVIAVAILDLPSAFAQRESVTSRRQQLLQRQQEQQQQAGLRRRLISRNRINSARKQTSAPVENEATQTLPAEPPLTTQAFTSATEPSIQEDIPEEVRIVPEEPPVQEIPEPVPVVPVEPVRTRSKTPSQTRPSSRIPAVPKETAQQVQPEPKARPSKTKEEEKKPIVETIRRYSFENEDGSFTFGYENADGSFKEETRGADCVVRGKYGYIDPDGVRREFTYVSGNPCDPNKKDEEEQADTSEEEIPKPVTQQRRPNTPRPIVQRPPVVNQVHVQTQQTNSEEEHDITEVLRNNPAPQRNRPVNNRPVDNNQRIQRPRPAVAVANHEDSSRFESVIQPSKPAFAPNTIAAPVKPPTPTIDFDAEVQRFSGSLPASRTPVQRPAPRPVEIEEDEDNQPKNRPTGSRSFTSELVFDRNANQFHSAVLQRIPEANTEISFREKLVAFVSTTTSRPEQSPVLRQTTPSPVRVPPSPQSPVVREPEIDFNSFGPPAQEIERQRVIQQQRPQQAFIPQSQPFNPQPAFNPSQPRVQQQFIPQQFPAQQPQFNAVNPFAPGLSPQQFFGQQQFNQQRTTFNPPQPQQFPPPQIVQPQNPQNRAQPLRPSGPPENFATGQIDSFLSSLG